MAKRDFGCGREECGASTGIDGSSTFGTGALDLNGYWEYPCKICEQADKASYITTGFGMGGYHAVKRAWYEEDQMWDNCQTSGKFRTYAEAATNAQEWAKAEGIECHA